MKTFKFELTEEEANVILAGLQELPGKVCNPLSQKLIEQAKEQLEGTEGKVINHSIQDTLHTSETLN
jgi:hypothetical protein